MTEEGRVLWPNRQGDELSSERPKNTSHESTNLETCSGQGTWAAEHRWRKASKVIASRIDSRGCSGDCGTRAPILRDVITARAIPVASTQVVGVDRVMVDRSLEDFPRMTIIGSTTSMIET